MSWITFNFIIALLLLTIFIKRISERNEDKTYVDVFDIPFYGRIEELTPYLNQSKQMDVEEITGSFILNNKYIIVPFKDNKENV